MTSPRPFLQVMPTQSPGVYFTERVSTDANTVYQPLRDATMINVVRYDQVTLDVRRFFVGDEHGRWCGDSEGHVVNFWRYDPSERVMHVAYSLAFGTRTSPEAEHAFLALRAALQGMCATS